ncbi:hypothetical protein BCU85_09100 [Vibrio lentus]|uniref:hypothetical protein n=1 Tax=Vibrio lentus TaxID=136468 RepID=UPI000C83313A|nr:hypothetical protein [Vibrio lentus]MCC4818433.1 hypothetical protein [Vibrio lentus]PMG68347.1 hypothetical protein BCU85_09100 [Vibrio lentus]PMK94757.1 hypothetical protein BCT88_00340 [Vibrio lentus]PML24561.1 hypothetical protein BCT80_22410 [Vibrio lentus]PMM21724.1 hypothetical protein BCT57_11685 [Vibrio lentus]
MISKIANDTNVKEMSLNKGMENKELDVNLECLAYQKVRDNRGVSLVKAIDSDLWEVWVQEIKWPPVNHY